MTTSDGVRERLTRVVQSVSHDDMQNAAVQTFVLLGSEGIFDSMTAFRLVVAIENEFDIVIADSEINPDRFRSIDSLERFIREKLKTKAP